MSSEQSRVSGSSELSDRESVTRAALWRGKEKRKERDEDEEEGREDEAREERNRRRLIMRRQHRRSVREPRGR